MNQLSVHGGAAHRPKHISKALPVVETLAEEDTGDSLTRPVLAWINSIMLLKPMKRIV
jgi:hypothetical protein